MAQVDDKKFNRVSQGDMPRSTLREVIVLADALRDHFAGKGATPINLAAAIDRSPTSSGWRILTGSAVAYGVVDGGYAASTISLTPLGKNIVMPTQEGEASSALLTALLRPVVLKNFYEKYDGAKFPKDDIAKNVLRDFGVPYERADEALKIVVENAKYTRIITDVGNAQYIQLHSAAAIKPADPEGRQPAPLSGNITPPFRKEPKGWDDFQIPIVEEKMYIEIPQAIYKRSFLDDELNDDLRALIKQAFSFAKKYIPKDESTEPQNRSEES